jgi:hypothetical protein
MNARERKRLEVAAIHESAHAVVAEHFGWKVWKLILDPPQIEISPSNPATLSEEERKPYCHFLMAGIHAEARHLGREWETVFEKAGGSDFRQLRRVLNRWGLETSLDEIIKETADLGLKEANDVWPKGSPARVC